MDRPAPVWVDEVYTIPKYTKYCFVPECKNVSTKTPDKHFFTVPKNNKEEWCRAIGKLPVPKRPLFICEDHLDLENDLENYESWKLKKRYAKLRPKVPCLKKISKPAETDIDEPGLLGSRECCERRYEDNCVSATPIIEEDGPSRLSTERLVQQYKAKFPRDKEMSQKWKNNIPKPGNEVVWMPSNSSSVCSENFESDVKYTAPQGPSKLKTSAAPFTKLKEPMTQPGASGNNSHEATSYSDHESLDSNASETGDEGPFGIQPLDRCRFCAVFSKDCIKVTDEDRHYLTGNKTTLTLNDLSVEVDFNDASPITVCRDCDSKLLVMFDFLQQVKEAQDSLINVRDYVKEEQEEDIGVKTECESPTPEDDIIDSKDSILDSLTVSETVFIKPIHNHNNDDIKHISKVKRKSIEETPKIQKKPKVTRNVEIKSEESELINVKEEIDEVDAYVAEKSEFSETKTATKSSELELANCALVNEYSEHVIFSK